MIAAIDRIVITVPSLAEAIKQYRQLLGVEPASIGPVAAPRAWFLLPNTVIELAQGPGKRSHIQGIALAAAVAGDQDTAVENARGLDIRLNDGSGTAALRADRAEPADGCPRVDHLVLRTADAADCIDLFGGQLGIRLALDRTVPEWGGRMLFFRTGKATIEVIEPVRDKPAADYFWGIAYQCPELDEAARLLAERGVSLSGIRVGRKPGTRVATVKSHCLGIPTLLLEPA